MCGNTAIQRPPWGAALRADKEAATAHAAAAQIRGLKAPFEQGDSVPPHPPRLIGKCNCRRGELVVDAKQGPVPLPRAYTCLPRPSPHVPFPCKHRNVPR